MPKSDKTITAADGLAVLANVILDDTLSPLERVPAAAAWLEHARWLAERADPRPAADRPTASP